MQAMQDQPAAVGPLERAGWPGDGLTAQHRFERERDAATELGRPLARLFGVGRLLRPSRRAHDGAPAAPTGVPRHLDGLLAAGCVLLDDRRTSLGRRRVDHLIVAPAGLFAVEVRQWRGQVQVSDGELYVDGRLRLGVPDAVAATALVVQQVLDDELSALGLSVTPVLCLPRAESVRQAPAVGGVIVACGRDLVRHVRHAPALMGAETVVRVALAADRLLERDPTAIPR